MKTKRQITPAMAKRIFRLMEHCAISCGSERLTIMPRSNTFDGKAIPDVTFELHLLLCGHRTKKLAKI